MTAYRKSGQAEDQIRFQARLLEAVDQAVIATDLGGIITYWNHAAEGLYGWTASEVLGRHILDAMPDAAVRPLATGDPGPTARRCPLER